MRFLKDESGSVAVMVAVSLVAVLGMMGLAIDVGQLRLTKQRLQMTADAAALAGALELAQCAGIANCSTLTTAVQDALTENNLTGSTLLTNCAIGSTTMLTITVNNGPCALGAANPHNGNRSFVEVVVSQPQPTYFAGVLGINSVLIRTRSEAGRTGGSNCIFALDPTGANSLTVDLLAAIYSPNCGIVVESSSSSALSCSLFASITASRIGVVGGYSAFLCGISPTPTTNIGLPNPSDPLAYLPKPAIPSCGASHSASPVHHGSDAQLVISTTTTLFPDMAYCGGIVIAPLANVTFMPGTYNLKSTKTTDGGLRIDLGTTVSGTGVTFYNYGPYGAVAFPFTSFTFGGVNLIAPTSGAYSGILFFQDPQNTSTAVIEGSTSWNTVLQGAYYFPNAKVQFALDGYVAYSLLVAKDIEFLFLTVGGNTVQSGSNNSNDFSSLANGSPQSSSGAVLVQ
jgi:Flp pilus assembly protein TadG